jgi:small subunit ribosomal protein S6
VKTHQYETIFVADATFTDEEIDDLIKGYEQVIATGQGKVLKVEKWGKRRLAYPILRQEEGHYVLLVFESPAGLVRELERRYRMNDRVLRHLTVRVESEAQLGPSPMMKPRPEREDAVPDAAPAV